MRLSLEISLATEELNVDYRSGLISFLKNGLTKYANGAYFERYYAPAAVKPFTFAVYLGKSSFNGDKINIPHKHIKISWSTGDMETAVIFCNSFQQQKHQWYPLPLGNKMRLELIAIEQETVITGNEIEVEFIAPLCVRDHCQETNKDRYFSYGQDGFEQTLQMIIRNQLRQGKLPETLADDFGITPIKSKKTVIKHYGQCVEATLGTFTLQGDIELLRLLYLEGMASKRSSGFGCFNIVK